MTLARTPILVRYADTDRMGIVHHARFLEYLEIGRVDLMKVTGVSYRELEARDVLFPVLEVWVRYRRSITFDDSLNLETWYRELKRTQVTFGYRLFAPDGAVAAEALTLHCQIDRGGKAVAIDSKVFETIRPLIRPDDLPRGRLQR